MIDTHTHVVADNRDRYPLNPRPMSGPWYLEAPHTADQLAARMGEAGIDRAVLVQAVGAYSYDNDYAADAAAAQPGRFASACCVDAEAPGAVDALRYWIAERGMHGVRLFALAREGPSWLAAAKTAPLFEEAAHLGAHVIVTIFRHQLEELRDVLRRFPTIRMSLDHCAFPNVAHPEPLFALAAEPNLFCKVSTVVLDSAGDAAAAFVSRLVSRFGAARVMWGSDFSQTHDRSYAELVRLARQSFATLTSSEREQCFVVAPRTCWPALG